jgi:hypothetical protein
VEELIDDKEHIKSKLKYINNLRNICEKKIIKLCNHEFINDVIDINPEKSQNITYCKICEYTLPI